MLCGIVDIGANTIRSVSYTHLDVYKRQVSQMADQGATAKVLPPFVMIQERGRFHG